MNKGAYIFSQIMGLVSHKKSPAIVNQHLGDYKVRDFTCLKQYLSMALGQFRPGPHVDNVSGWIGVSGYSQRMASFCSGVLDRIVISNRTYV
jgi:hypothetical protein